MKRIVLGVIGASVGAGASWIVLGALLHVGRDSFLLQLTTPIGGVYGLIIGLLIGRRVKRRLR